MHMLDGTNFVTKKELELTLAKTTTTIIKRMTGAPNLSQEDLQLTVRGKPSRRLGSAVLRGHFPFFPFACERSEPATDLSSFVDFLLLSSFDAFRVTFLLVVI
jgi:hypothetical protein